MPPLAALLRNQLTVRLSSTSRSILTSPSHSQRKLSSEPLKPLLPRGTQSLPSPRAFSSTPKARDAGQPKPLPKSPPKAEPGNQNANPGFESVSIVQMFGNSSRSVKIVLIAGLCLMATAETVAWTIWGWDYVKGYFGMGDEGKGGDEK